MASTTAGRPLLRWTLTGIAAGLLIGCVRLTVLAAYWPHGRGLLWYFVFGFLDTVIIAGAAGAAVGVLIRRSRAP
jgi:hypothetical protein